MECTEPVHGVDTLLGCVYVRCSTANKVDYSLPLGMLDNEVKLGDDLV